jgi:hypothetical protein
MKTVLKILSVVLLLFNGIGAIYGGLHLLLHPDGSSLGISTDWLKHSPFDSFFIPGLVLFLVNGLFDFFVLWQMVSNKPESGLYVLAQGTVLCGWILIQILMLQTVYFLHYTLGGIGLALVFLGYVLRRKQKGSSTSH